MDVTASIFSDVVRALLEVGRGLLSCGSLLAAVMAAAIWGFSQPSSSSHSADVDDRKDESVESDEVLTSIIWAGSLSAVVLALLEFRYSTLSLEFARAWSFSPFSLVALLSLSAAFIISLLAIGECIKKTSRAFTTRAIAYGWVIAVALASFKGKAAIFVISKDRNWLELLDVVALVDWDWLAVAGFIYHLFAIANT